MSRTNKELDDFVTGVAKEIEKAGGKTYMVGGCVRDSVLGRPQKDIDLEIHRVTPEVLKEILRKFGQVNTIGESFGIYQVAGYDIDFALPRKETANGRGGHKDFEVMVDPFCGIPEAARRRDFTMNALYMDVLDRNTIIDPFGGLEDIEHCVIKVVDETRFVEDPLRVLRAARFAHTLRFDVDERTAQLCRTMDLSTLPKERIYGEMVKTFAVGTFPGFFLEVENLGQTSLFKELFDLKGIEQNKEYHLEDVFTHTMWVLRAIMNFYQDRILKESVTPQRDIFKGTYLLADPKYLEVLCLTALCHDMGKAKTSTIGADGISHNYGHEKETEAAKAFLGRLTNNKTIIKQVLFLCENHMRPTRYAQVESNRTKTNTMFDEAEKIAPGLSEALIDLSYADCIGRDTKREDPKINALKYRAFLTQRLEEYRELCKTPEVTGQDLIDLGMTPGPDFLDILQKAHHLYLAGVPKEHILKQVDNPVLKERLKEQQVKDKGLQFMDELESHDR